MQKYKLRTCLAWDFFGKKRVLFCHMFRVYMCLYCICFNRKKNFILNIECEKEQIWTGKNSQISLKFYLSYFWSSEVKLLYAFMCLKYNLMRYFALLSKNHHLENCKSFCCDFQNKNRCLKTKEKWTYWNHKECMTWVYKFTWAECSRLAKVSRTTLCLFQVNLFDA